MHRVEVDVNKLDEILDAALRTAEHQLGSPREAHALGVLEATANVIYVLLIGTHHGELEAKCQRLACQSIERLQELGFDASMVVKDSSTQSLL